MIYTRNLVHRDKAKQHTLAEQEELNRKVSSRIDYAIFFSVYFSFTVFFFHRKIKLIKEERASKWKKLTAASPFAVDLVAEDERIAEEARVRLEEEEKKRKEFMKRRDQAKNEIVLKVGDYVGM